MVGSEARRFYHEYLEALGSVKSMLQKAEVCLSHVPQHAGLVITMLRYINTLRGTEAYHAW